MSGEEEIIEVTIDMGELKKMKVPELKKKVAELGLPTKGTKAELLARVEKYLHEQEEEEELLEEEEEEEEEVGVEEEEVESEGGEEVEESTLDESKTDAVLEETEPKQVDNPASIEPAMAIKKTTVSVSNLAGSQAERVAQRAAKFGGNSSEEAKKLARAERFGPAQENGYQGLGKRAPPTEQELERLKKRAERFGSSVSPAITSMEEEEKKKKRSERFGLSAVDHCVEDRKKLRAARFGTS